MTEDANHAAVLAVLTENGVTSSTHDLDTLATLIVAAINNPATPDVEAAAGIRDHEADSS